MTDEEKNLDWKVLSNKITNMPTENAETIYRLILCHHDLNKKGISTTIPYKAQNFDKGRGVLYTVSNLPETLKLIIAAYVNLVT